MSRAAFARSRVATDPSSCPVPADPEGHERNVSTPLWSWLPGDAAVQRIRG